MTQQECDRASNSSQTLRTRPTKKVFFLKKQGHFFWVFSSSRLFVFWPRIMPKMSQNKSDLSTFLPTRISPLFLCVHKYSNFAMMNHRIKIWKVQKKVCVLQNHFWTLDIIEHILMMRSNQEMESCNAFILFSHLPSLFWGYSNSKVQFAKNLHIWKEMQDLFQRFESRRQQKDFFFNALFSVTIVMTFYFWHFVRETAQILDILLQQCAIKNPLPVYHLYMQIWHKENASYFQL